MHRSGRLVVGAAAALAVVAALMALDRDRDRRSGAGAPDSAGSPTATATSSAEPTPEGPPALLPNMRSLNAFGMRIERTSDRRLLRFAAALANLGPGPLLLNPRPGRAGCPPRRHRAVQRVYRDGDDDGRYRRTVDPVAGRPVDVGCMLRHPGHDHWHFDAMARYSLRLAGTDEPLASRKKVSFCLRDNRRVPDVPTRVRREHFGECTRRSRQGISPGWVDVYDADLDGQTLTLPAGVDGRQLCLDLVADPRGVLLETDETDNGTTVGLRVRGTRVTRAGTSRCD